MLWYYLWVAPHAFQGIIVFAMLRRRLHRSFPMFFLYTLFEILQFGALFAISRSHFHFGGGYVYAFSLGLALSTAIRFSVIYELFGHFFRRYPALDQTGKLLFQGTTIVLLLVALGLAVFAPGGGAGLLLKATYALDRTASILQCGLLISLFLFSRYFALSWRSHAFGIALGLGIFASMELASSAVWLRLGAFGNATVNLASMAVYNCCVLIWMFYLLAPERVPQSSLKKLPEYDLEIWNQELRRLLQQ
jgi:hypothetical protein